MSYEMRLKESRVQFQAHGPTALSPVELLSLVLNQDAEDLWGEYQSLMALQQAGWQELLSWPGIGEARAFRLKAAMELGHRLLREERGPRPRIDTPDSAADLLMPQMRNLLQEQLWTLLLDIKSQVIKTVPVYIGTASTITIRASEVLRPAIQVNATAMILAHNHPSGDPTPSEQDKRVTRQLIKAGVTVGVEVLDHIIIGHNGYVSLRQEGVKFDSNGFELGLSDDG